MVSNVVSQCTTPVQGLLLYQLKNFVKLSGEIFLQISETETVGENFVAPLLTSFTAVVDVSV